MGSFAAQGLPLVDEVTLTLQQEGYDQIVNVTVSVSLSFLLPCRGLHRTHFLTSSLIVLGSIPRASHLRTWLHGAGSTAEQRRTPMVLIFMQIHNLTTQDRHSTTAKQRSWTRNFRPLCVLEVRIGCTSLRLPDAGFFASPSTFSSVLYPAPTFRFPFLKHHHLR